MLKIDSLMLEIIQLFLFHFIPIYFHGARMIGPEKNTEQSKSGMRLECARVE